MIAQVRRAIPARRDDRGTSLTELLVTMLVFGVVIAATATLTIGFSRVNTQTIVRQDQVDDARVSVESMSKALRTAVMPKQLTCASCTADAFVVGQDFSVQFYANINNPNNTVGPSRVTYTIATTGADAGKLVQKIQVPDSNIAGADGYPYCNAEIAGASSECKARLTRRVLAEGVQTVAGKPVFAYYNGTGGRLDPSSSGGALPATALGQVLAIEVTLSVRRPAATAIAPTTYIQRITLPNAQSALRQNKDDA